MNPLSTRALPRRAFLGRGGHLAVALAAVLLLAGCAGVTPSQYCYRVSAATVHAVDLSMNVAGDLYRAGKITDAQKGKLVSAHDAYRPIADGVVTACEAVKTVADAEAQAKKIQAEGDKVLSALVAAGAR